MTHSIAGLNVSRETFDRLKLYEGLLQKWNPAINLVSKATLGDLWRRHFVDSAQVYKIAPAEPHHWADLGSGGGFPGAVVAILAAEKSPETHVTLVESDQRKATFLRTVAISLGLNLTVRSERIEKTQRLNADVLSARALAPLDVLLGFAHQHLRADGRALFLKGAQYKEELAKAEKTWQFSYKELPSQTDPSAVVLSIGEIAHV